MSTAEVDLESQVEPWEDQELLDEQEVIDRMEAVVAKAREAGATEAARLAVIAIGNYVWQAQEWPKFVERANELLDEFDDKLSRRWGVKGPTPKP